MRLGLHRVGNILRAMSLPAYRLGTPKSPFNRRTDERWREYSNRKHQWRMAHPNASRRELEAAARVIFRELGLAEI